MYGASAVAVAPLTDISVWSRSTGLEIVLIVVGAILLARFVSWFGDRVTHRIDDRATGGDALVRSEGAKHRHAVTQVLTWIVLVLIYSLTAVWVLSKLGVPLTGFVAPATVAGVALGFGAQRVVQDLLAGFFLITEKQYGYGDVIKVSVPGTPNDITGTVEDVTLRITRIRTANGEVVTTPNGQIVQVTNLSRDWARAVVDVPVPADADVNRVSEMLRQIGDDAYDDPQLRPLLLDQPSVMGVESLAVDEFNVRMVARTLPGKQFEVGRALRSRITMEFLRADLKLDPAVNTADSTAMADDTADDRAGVSS